ncbi:MAG: glutathione peroxidase [Spongiibacteraceae bacterium]
MSASVYEFSAHSLSGEPVSLADYSGRVLLIVNTASKCGFTPQYQELEQLYERYREQGFAVLGFPCNQFGQQEPGDANAIGAFCEKNYGVNFPMFEKIDVNGEQTHPLYRHLKAAAPGLLGTQSIKWNFTKFLVDRSGLLVKRYAPKVKPLDITRDIEELLARVNG